MTEDMLTRIMSPALVEMITTTLGATFRAGEEQCKQEGTGARKSCKLLPVMLQSWGRLAQTLIG